MGAKHQIYWYKEASVAVAFLYNCRDNDLRYGGTVPAGAIVSGVSGYVAAEKVVTGFSGVTVAFQPSRSCEWQGFTLRCMVHSQMPPGPITKKDARPYNYIVAELTEADAVDRAEEVGLPIITDATGTRLVNLECGVFQKQGNQSPRRARIL